MRLLRLFTEENLGSTVSVKHPAFTWLVEHSADVISKFNVQSDGRTSYERLKGREYTGMMMEFGMVVLYKLDLKPAGEDMAPRWGRGIWLGERFATEEHVISTAAGNVVRSAAVRPHPEKMWDRELFDRVKGVPWDPSGRALGDESGVDLPR